MSRISEYVPSVVLLTGSMIVGASSVRASFPARWMKGAEDGGKTGDYIRKIGGHRLVIVLVHFKGKLGKGREP